MTVSKSRAADKPWVAWGISPITASRELRSETDSNLFDHNVYGINQILLVAWLRSVFVTRRRGEPNGRMPMFKKGLYSTYQHQSQ